MLLDRIDIDAHGPLHRVELGPFAEHLNVVCTPPGSGKTAIARFVRDTVSHRNYPAGMFGSSTGRVVWADRDGMVHCCREQDGTHQGRRRVQFEPRGEFENRWNGVSNTWLQHGGDTSAENRCRQSLEIPEAIVDGVITDTAVTSVARVVSACVRSGLDSADLYTPLPLAGDHLQEDEQERSRRTLRGELAEVEAELARHGSQPQEYDHLIQRREQLSLDLMNHASNCSHHDHPTETLSYEAWRRQLNGLHDRARELRSRQGQLQQWIAETEQAWRVHDASATAASFRFASRTRAEHQRRVAELHRVTDELDVCLADAAALRRTHPHSSDAQATVGHERTAILDELHKIDEQLSAMSRIGWLKSRRDRVREQLHGAPLTAATQSPLAAAASQWLVRLTSGRLSRIHWHGRDLIRGDYHQDCHGPTGVTINGTDESHYPASDRAIAAIAVRMAAGNILKCIGRHVPLVLETQQQMWAGSPENTGANTASEPYLLRGTHQRWNHPLATALRDYTRDGGQVLVLTSDRELADELQRSDARRFDLHKQRTVHAHRPIWRAKTQSGGYAGPHPIQSHDWTGRRAELDRRVRATSTDDINRDLDLAWHEAYGSDDASASSVPSEATDWARDGKRYRDGYFYNDSFTTDDRADKAETSHHHGEPVAPSEPTRKPRSPFLLSVDSPIDQAPSIDAVAASRLRGLDVTHVTHLMQRDANRLADALGLANVDASTIRRWQAEARLCCQVPHLRNFDAKILVGCGITSPSQLAATHPIDLLGDVESFLATERGQQILRSGSSHELARITTWIATANSKVRVSRTKQNSLGRRASQSKPLAGSLEMHPEHVSFGHRYNGTDEGSATPVRRRRRVVTSSPSTYNRESADADITHPPASSGDSVLPYGNEDSTLRFYLHRNSPVEDAPSIGSKMAERLDAVGIETVDDLLSADAEEVANALDHRRVDADTVTAWQHQATLVCRVPGLRGHDAQLLVAADITTPEDLSECEAESLFGWIDPIANSNRGRRILRGGPTPDLAEVANWIQWAQQTRELKAA